MTLAANLVGWLIVVAFTLMTLAFLVETFLGLFPNRHTAAGAELERPVSTAVLIPAHDEALIIADALAMLRAQVPDGTRILVVADNCSDNTADIARASGAEVVERTDPERRGKGYALDFGRKHLRASAPEVVVVLDADCTIDRISLVRLASVAMSRQAAAQARYLLEPSRQAAPMVQISSFAFMVKNFIRQRGAARLGAAAILTGTGMAFPWPMFDELSFSGGIVEDLDLTIDLAARGLNPLFVPEAVVLSMPAPVSAGMMQRDRWERGFVSAAKQSIGPILKKFASSAKASLLWLALHLLTPPLALLMVIASLCAALLILLHILAGMSLAPLLIHASLLVIVGILVGAAWMTNGREYMSLRTVLKIPLYILWKLPIYARILIGAEKLWNRTDRSIG